MIKTARQLKDLIRNLSKDKSADAQILMRNYMMERFLEYDKRMHIQKPASEFPFLFLRTVFIILQVKITYNMCQ